MSSKKEYMREYRKKRYQEMKARGICVICHKHPAVDGMTRCEECREKTNKQIKNGGYVKKRMERLKA